MRLTLRYFPLLFVVFAFAALANGVTLDWQEMDAAAPGMTSFSGVESAQPDGIRAGDTQKIRFATVPEINPGWSAVGSCLLAAALILRHSAKFRK
jgi:hypothetical protein